MQFTNEFRVPVDVDTAFATLTDLERVAPCLPGATLEEVDGDTYTGRVKIKVGPIQVTYRGTARVVEADADAKRGRIEASGKEQRGSGTASADVVATLVADEAATLVKVVTDLNVTGKPAQFGRGVMEDVGTKIINTFADRLRDMLEAGQADDEVTTEMAAATVGGRESGPEAVATGAAVAAAPEGPGPRRIEPDPTREDDALDLMEMAGAATVKRVAPLVVAVLAIVGLVWWLRRR